MVVDAPSTTLLRGQRPIDDNPWAGRPIDDIESRRRAEMIAYLLLGALHSEPVLDQLATDGPGRLGSALRTLACALLDGRGA